MQTAFGDQQALAQVAQIVMSENLTRQPEGIGVAIRRPRSGRSDFQV